MNQMILSIFIAHIVSESFNFTSFSVISDSFGYETIEWDGDGEYAGGGGTLDRVVMNNWQDTYVRMYVNSGAEVWSIVIVKANDILQTKYVAGDLHIPISSTSIGDSVHIVIKNVTKNMGTSYNDADMKTDETTITINDGSDSSSYGTWTSTIEPENVTVELNCKVVDNSTDVIIAKCYSETTWDESVFNRIPIAGTGGTYAYFGYGGSTNRAMFGTRLFFFNELIPSGWNEYNVTGSGSYLTIGNQLTIKNLPESFVSHWVNTIHAKAYMGNGYMMFVPPE